MNTSRKGKKLKWKIKFWAVVNRPVHGPGYPSKSKGPPEIWEDWDKYTRPDDWDLDKI